MKVKLKEDINLKDLKENHWEGCMSWTLQFLEKYYDTKEEFEAEEANEGGYKIYGTNIEKDYIVVNKKCFEIIEEDKKIPEKIEYYHQYDECCVKDKFFQDKIGSLVDEIIIDKINEIIDYLEEKE